MSPKNQRRTFISYSRINKEFALKLALELRSSGFDVWLDQLDIPTGSRWDDEVERALEDCEIFMVILTPASSTSDNVKDEIGYAIDSGKRILPILLENAKVPLRLIRFQYVDFTKKSYEEGVESAKQLLRRLIEEPTIPRDQVSAAAQMPATGSAHPEKATKEPKPIPVQETKKEPGGEFKAEKAKQEEKGTPTAGPEPPALVPVPQQPDTSAAPPTKKSRLPLVLGTAGVGFIAVVAFAIYAILNGSGGETPNADAPENNLSAGQAVPSPAPLVIEVEITSTPAPTHTAEPAQPTDTMEPTAVPDTATPALQKYFTEEFSGNLETWPMFVAEARQSLDKPVIAQEELDDVGVRISDGIYFFDIGSRQTFVYSYYDSFQYEDVRLDVRVDSRNNNIIKTSMICRYSPEGGWYEFRIANNGPYEIIYAKPNPTGLINYRVLANGNATNTNPGNDTNEYAIVCQGDDNLSLYVNGELVRTTSDLFKELRLGKVGVAISSINSLPVRAGFDWIKISEPE